MARSRTRTIPRATWARLFREAGFHVERVRRPLGEGAWDEVFVGRKLGGG